MKFKAGSGIMLTLLLIGMLTLAFSVQPVQADSTTPTVWVDPPSIDGTNKVGQLINVSVMVNSPDIGIWTWQVGIRFDPNILECTSLPPDTYVSPFFAGKYTLPILCGKINNTLGCVGICSQTLRLPETTGVTGTGVLMWFEFEVLAEGISDLHIEDAALVTGLPAEQIPVNVIDTYTVTVEGTKYVVDILHNIDFRAFRPSGLHNHNFSLSEKKLSFVAKGTSGQLAFCNVAIPRNFMWCGALTDWVVKVSGNPVPKDVTENATHTFIYFTFATSTVNIEIISTYVASKPVGGKATPINIPTNKPETPTLWIWLTTITLSLAVTVVYVKKRKRNTEINS